MFLDKVTSFRTFISLICTLTSPRKTENSIFWLLLYFRMRSTIWKMKDDVFKGESAEAQTW